MKDIRLKLDNGNIKYSPSVVEENLRGTIIINFSYSNYVDSAYVYPNTEECIEDVSIDKMELHIAIHLGMTKDSVNINNLFITPKMKEIIDIRYFPAYQPLRFYVWQPGKYKVYIKNNGVDEILLSMPNGETVMVKAGEKKEIIYA